MRSSPDDVLGPSRPIPKMPKCCVSPLRCGPHVLVTRSLRTRSLQSCISNWPADLSPSEQANVRPLRMRRGRGSFVAVAAGLALVGGTAAVTEIANTATVQRSATAVPQEQALRTATFEAPTGQVAGQIVLYHGHPSWVYMNVDVPRSNGTVKCELHLANGEVVAAGTVQLHDGNGVLSKNIGMDAGKVRGATLYDSSGAVVASAIFI